MEEGEISSKTTPMTPPVELAAHHPHVVIVVDSLELDDPLRA